MRFRVSCPVAVVASVWVEVDADSPADALVAAEGLPSSSWTLADLAPSTTDLEVEVDDQADVWPVDRYGVEVEP